MKKFDNAACALSVLRVKALFLRRARECSADPKWKDLVPTYRADARAVGHVAKLLEGEQPAKAFGAWQGLDSFPRDFFPRRTVKFMRSLAAREVKGKG